MTTPDTPPATVNATVNATVDAAALRRLLDGGDPPQIIDVRTPGEFAAVHIPGSRNVPLDLLRAHHATLRPRLDEGAVLAGARLPRAKWIAAVPRAKWIAAGIGAGLTFAAVSDTCAMGMLLSRLPYNRGPRTDLAAVLDSLAGGRG
ncbi:rhodanese-like domain-containing protein [Nonomuraea sp. NPDC049684]|uniref:rhodanese-like domain-containing protein n=1 Tax=Nonomuraea sp. NPDC049684 TaxID=3364356 RepID=UPI0037B3BC7B